MSNHYPLHWRRLMGIALMLVVSASTMLAQWTELQPLSGELYVAQNALIGNKLYTFGGLGIPSAGGNRIFLSEARMLDLASPGAVWSTISPLPETRYGGYAGVVNGKAYIIGGVRQVGNQVTFLPQVLEYNPATDTYVEKAPIPTPLFYISGAVVGTKIYIFGGAAISGSTFAVSNKTQVYDAATDEWSTATNIPTALQNTTATNVNGEIYLIGGQNSSGSIYKTAHRGKIDGSSITWTALPNYPDFIHSAAAGTLDGNAYVTGGVTAAGTNNQTHYFDATTNAWVKTYPLPVAAQYVNNMPGDGSAVYFIGGTGNEKVFKLTPGVAKPIAVVPSPTLLFTVQKGTSKMATLEIKNEGSAPLTGTLSAPADAKWLTGEAVTIEPFSSMLMNVTADAATLTAGSYKTTATLTTDDADNKTIPISVRLYVLENAVLTQPTAVVMEEATGAWCGPCGAYGTPLVRQMKETYGEQLITIANHNRSGGSGDAMATTESEAVNQRLGTQYFPSAAVNRWDFPYKQNMLSLLREEWDHAISDVLLKQPEAPVAIEVMDQKYDPATKLLSGKVKLTISQAISLPTGTSLRLTGVLLEDSIQLDQYLGTEDPYYHMHVTRDYWPDLNGKSVTIPPSATEENGTILKPGTELTVDVSIPSSSVKVAKQGHIVFFAHLNRGTVYQQILQGHESHLMGDDTPTGPAIAVITLDNDKTVSAESTGEFTAEVHNLTDKVIELSVARTKNTLPSGWTSQICIVDDCSPTSQSTVLQSVLPKSTVTVKLKIVTSSPGEQAVVALKFSSDGTEQTEEFTLNTTGTSGINDPAVATGGLMISNFPNPVTAATRFDYNLPKAGVVGIDLFTLVGEKVKSLFSARQEAGNHTLNADLASLPNGVYTVVLTVDGTKVTRTITIAR